MSYEISIRDKYLDTLEKWQGAPIIKVLSGMRRVGKSVLLRQWANRLKARPGFSEGAVLLLERDSLGWLHLEDWKGLREVVTPWVERNPGPKALLIDEVQLIDWSGKTHGYRSGMRPAPGDAIVVPERNFTRGEVVQIVIAVAGLLVSGVAITIAATR